MSDKFNTLVRDVREELERDATIAKPPLTFVRNQVTKAFPAARAKAPFVTGPDSLAREEAYAKLIVELVDVIKPKCKTIGAR